MSDAILINSVKHLSKLSNVKNSRIMLDSIIRILQKRDKNITDKQAYRVAVSVLGS